MNAKYTIILLSEGGTLYAIISRREYRIYSNITGTSAYRLSKLVADMVSESHSYLTPYVRQDCMGWYAHILEDT